MKANHFITVFYIALVVSMLVHPACGHTQTKDKPGLQTIFNYLTKDEGTKMTLEADLTTISANKKTNQYFPGSLIMANGKQFKVELRPRGRYRRKISTIPPLKIKFSKKNLRAEGLDTLNDIKLVLPALDNDQGNELVIKEYLAYRMFEALTPISLRARLIRLTLTDTHVEQTRKNIYAILVEDAEEMAYRLHGKQVEDYGIPADSLNTNQAALMVMFEYMIGNTDWEIAMLRNVRLIRPSEPGKMLVMPYDFDFSGFVSAPYALPSTESGLKSVRDRFLMSSGIKPDALKRAHLQIKNSKSKLYEICGSKHLSRTSYDEIIGYLDVYFSQTSDKDEVPKLLKMPIAD
jgi:hypothetical protein